MQIKATKKLPLPTHYNQKAQSGARKDVNNWKLHPLLVGMRTGTATLENSCRFLGS